MIPACGAPPAPAVALTASVDELLTGIPAGTLAHAEEDEVLRSIFGSLMGLTQAQANALAALYGDLRARQEAMATNGRRGGKRQLRRALGALNEEFLEAGEALMRPEQLQDWADCAALIDLMPAWSQPPGATPAGGPPIGTPAPDFALTTLDGQVVRLSDLRGRTVVIEFGSFTCPSFRKAAAGLEVARRRHSDDVVWLVIYGAEAHPSDGRESPENRAEGISHPQHRTMGDRMEMAALARDSLGLERTLVVDDLNDTATRLYEGHPNRLYVVGVDGTVVAKQVRPDPLAVLELIEG